MEIVQVLDFFYPRFHLFGLYVGNYSVNLDILSECQKMRATENFNSGRFSRCSIYLTKCKIFSEIMQIPLSLRIFVDWLMIPDTCLLQTFEKF